MLYSKHIAKHVDVEPFNMPLLKNIGDECQSEDLLPSQNINIEEIEREAYEKGFEEGEKAGLAMGEQKAMILIDRLEELINELITLKQKLIQELEPQLVELAVSMARKIAMKELTVDPDNIVEMTKEVMKRLERTGQITIKINPSLYELFVKHKPGLMEIHPDIAFEVDPSATPTGSVVISSFEEGVIDIDEQIRNLIKEMGEKLGSN